MCLCPLPTLCLTPSLGAVLLTSSLHFTQGLLLTLQLWSICTYKPFSYLQLTVTGGFCRTPVRCVFFCPSMELRLCSSSSYLNVTAMLSLPFAANAAHLESSCKSNCPSMCLSPCHATSALPRWFPISFVAVLFVACPILMSLVTSHSVSRGFARVPDVCLHCICAGFCALSHAWKKQAKPPHIDTS